MESVEVSVTTVGLTGQRWPVLIEAREIEQRVLADRSHRLVEEIEAHRELLRNLAHEVKNPLGGLRGAAQLLEAELPNAALAEYTQVIISEADRLQALVDRLSGPQRVPLNARPVNIHEICERVCALIQAEFRDEITLLRDYDASVPDLKGDAARLMQAVLNVARNAAQELVARPRDAGVEHGLVTLRTRVARQVMLAHRQHRLALVLSIIDNGPGVPEHIRDRIFHPLVTARAGGTGLGLSLAQDFVQQHGGIIEFRIPARAHRVPPCPSDGARTLMKPVWIVDDDRAIRWVLERPLARAGIPTRSFPNRPTCWMPWRDVPSALVSDIRMPGGNGLELLRQLKERHAGLPVIVMTAFADLDSTVSAFQGGAFDYLPSPSM